MTPQIKLSTTTHRDRLIHTAHITFTGSENHIITLDNAARLTENYRRSVPVGTALGGFFSQRIFTMLLSQHTSVGLRIYLASEDDGSPTFILVAVNSINNDLIEGFLGAHPVMSTGSLVLQMSEPNSPHPVNAKLPTRADYLFSGNENHLTTLAEASRLTRNFRESARGTIDKGGFFGKNIFNSILSQPECVGIRIYHGLRNDRRSTFVLAGVDRRSCHFAKWPFGDEVFWCPPFCGPRNALNH